MHDDFQREADVKISSERSFGLTIAGGLAILSLLPAWHGGLGAIRWWLLAPAVVFAVLGLAWPSSLAPLNRLWAKFGLLLARVVSPLALGLVFYLTMVPLGWLMRALGKDPMRLRTEPEAKSYWITRDPPGPAPETMTNQF